MRLRKRSMNYLAQFSTTKSGTRSNSRTLFVTRIISSDLACAAISILGCCLFVEYTLIEAVIFQHSCTFQSRKYNYAVTQPRIISSSVMGIMRGCVMGGVRRRPGFTPPGADAPGNAGHLGCLITVYPFAQMRERVNRYICIYSVYVDKDLLLCYTENANK